MIKPHTPKFVDIGCVEKCAQHVHNIIIYYCNTHDEIGCYECMVTNHSECTTESIDSIAEGTKDSLEYRTLLDDISEVKSQAEKNEQKAVKNKIDSNICLSAVISDIRTFRHDIDAHLDQMELEVTSKVKQMNLEYQMVMNEIITECKNIQENTEKLLNALKEVAAKETKLFIKMKQKRTDIIKYKHKTERDKIQRTQSLLFEPNPFVADIFKTSKPLGELLEYNVCDDKGEKANQAKLEHDAESFKDEGFIHGDKYLRQDEHAEHYVLEEIEPSEANDKDAQVEKENSMLYDLSLETEFCKDSIGNNSQETTQSNNENNDDFHEVKQYKKDGVNAKLLSDKGDCDISGMDMLSENEIVLADYNNRSVKVVDLIQNKITDEIKLEYHPYDLTVPFANEVAVTLTNSIQMIEKSHLWRLGDSIKVDGECYGITSNNSKLFVTFIKPVPKVEILNHQGEVLQKLEMDPSNRKTFKRPRYIDVSPDEKFIYITDFETDSVLRISSIGDQTIVFSDANVLNGPYGIHVHNNGLVLVCNYGNDNILEFSADLSKYKMILSKTEGVESPQSIFMCSVQDRLFISCTDIADCNEVQIYRPCSTVN